MLKLSSLARLFAAFILLSTAYSSSAAIINLTVDITGTFSGNEVISGTNTGSGYGTFDTDTGDLNLTYSFRVLSPVVDFTWDQELSVNVNNSSFASVISTDCYNDVGNLKQCPPPEGLNQINTPPLSSMNVVNGNGSFSTSQLVLGIPAAPSGLQNDMIYNVTAVPVPAAIWLFGSALLGLAGIKRKR